MDLVAMALAHRKMLKLAFLISVMAAMIVVLAGLGVLPDAVSSFLFSPHGAVGQ